MDAVIDVTNLTCRYRSVEAVHGVSFAVATGTVFGLLGPNGAGKTTTIRALMNILRPSAGEARVLGVDSRRLGPSELQTIGYVSENQELPLWMTVAELLAYCKPPSPCSRRGLPVWSHGRSQWTTSRFRLISRNRVQTRATAVRGFARQWAACMTC